MAAFAEVVMRQPLWPHQLQLSQSTAFIRVAAAARRVGKTEYAELEAMWTALKDRNVVVLILSATEDAARRLTESIGQRLNANPLTKGAVVQDNATRIRLTNGSQIISLPASQRQVRGYGKGVRLVILDEAGLMPSELWEAAQYTAMDERPHSRILILGSPFGPRDHFFRRRYELGREGAEDHEAWSWPYTVNPQLDHAYLERERDRVSPFKYAAEVLGEWTDEAGALFTPELLEANTADLHIPRLGDLRGAARPIVALDWGVSFDQSAAIVLYRLPVADLNPLAPTLPRFVALPYVWPAKTELGRVVDSVLRVDVQWSYVAAEVNGVGAMPTQELIRGVGARRYPKVLHAITTTAQSKTVGYGALLSLLERRQLILPRHPELLRQLSGLRIEQGERGFTRIEATNEAVHDDVADALMLATLPVRRGGRLTSELMRIAHAPRQAPDTPLPEFDEAVVHTGDGLALHERPSLQSVLGSELTHFARPLPPQPVGVRRLVIPTEE